MVRNNIPANQRARGYGPAGEPGTSKRKNKPDYEANKAARAMQSSPCPKTKPRVRGPSKTPKGVTGTALRKYIQENAGLGRGDLGL